MVETTTRTYQLWQKFSNMLNFVGPFWDAEVDSPDGDNGTRFERGSADSHMDATAREEIRTNVRREVANNSYLEGQNRVAENDIIGRTPRIKITDNRFTKSEQRRIKKAFQQWVKDVRFASKLNLVPFFGFV